MDIRCWPGHQAAWEPLKNIYPPQTPQIYYPFVEKLALPALRKMSAGRLSRNALLKRDGMKLYEVLRLSAGGKCAALYRRAVLIGTFQQLLNPRCG